MCKLSQPPQRAQRNRWHKRTCSAAGISMTIREGITGTARLRNVALSGVIKPTPLCHGSPAHCPILYVERFRGSLTADRLRTQPVSLRHAADHVLGRAATKRVMPAEGEQHR